MHRLIHHGLLLQDAIKPRGGGNAAVVRGAAKTVLEFADTIGRNEEFVRLQFRYVVAGRRLRKPRMGTFRIEGAEQSGVRWQQYRGNIVDLLGRGRKHGCQSGGAIYGRQSTPPKVALNLSKRWLI